MYEYLFEGFKGRPRSFKRSSSRGLVWKAFADPLLAFDDSMSHKVSWRKKHERAQG